MKDFRLIVISYEENGTGILRENDCAVLACGIEKCGDIADIEPSRIGKIATDGKNIFAEKGRLLYMDKGSNHDIIKAVRIALSVDADGIIIPFGNNPSRPYIREGRAYTTREMQSAVWEVKRLAPLFDKKVRL